MELKGRELWVSRTNVKVTKALIFRIWSVLMIGITVYWFFFVRPLGVVDEGYFYFVKNENCIQRVQLMRNFSAFKNHCQWYSDNNKNFSDGIKLEAFSSWSLDPFEKFNIYYLDTLSGGVVYAYGYQLDTRGRQNKIKGYVPYAFKESSTTLNEGVGFCDEYLGDVTWDNLYSDPPDPRQRF